MKPSLRTTGVVLAVVASIAVLIFVFGGGDPENPKPPEATPRSQPLTEKQKIAKLLDIIEQSEGLIFVRNDVEYPAPAARKLVEYKMEKAADNVKTANDFIDQAASYSKTTGRLYMIKLSDGRTTESAYWLRARLKEIEQ